MDYELAGSVRNSMTQALDILTHAASRIASGQKGAAKK